MRTGDSRTTAEAVAGKLGLDEVVAEVLPDQKADVVKRLQGEGRIVAMAGDGINDAPALAEAQVGIAMGTGTDVAMESAGVTLVKGDLRGIVRARHLSRATMRNIKQNLFFAFVYNALGVPVAAGGLFSVYGMCKKNQRRITHDGFSISHRKQNQGAWRGPQRHGFGRLRHVHQGWRLRRGRADRQGAHRQGCEMAARRTSAGERTGPGYESPGLAPFPPPPGAHAPPP